MTAPASTSRRSGAIPPPAPAGEIPDLGVVAFAIQPFGADEHGTWWYPHRLDAEDVLADLYGLGSFGLTLAAIVEPFAVVDDRRSQTGALIVDPTLVVPVDVTFAARDRAEGLARAAYEREIRTQAVKRVEEYLGTLAEIVSYIAAAVGLEPLPARWVPLGWLAEDGSPDTLGAFDPATAEILVGLEVAIFRDDPWSTTVGVVLHEVAHGLATLDENDPGHGHDHGPAFDAAAHEIAEALGAPLHGRADPLWPFESVVGAELLRHLVDRLAKAQEAR